MREITQEKLAQKRWLCREGETCTRCLQPTSSQFKKELLDDSEGKGWRRGPQQDGLSCFDIISSRFPYLTFASAVKGLKQTCFSRISFKQSSTGPQAKGKLIYAIHSDNNLHFVIKF